MPSNHDLTYEQYVDCLKGRDLPCALVNLDALDQNIEKVKEAILRSDKPLRIATKSVRIPWLLHYLKGKFGDRFGGFMCYTVQEAAFLAEQGFDDFLVAYPTVLPSDMNLMAEMTLQGKDIKLIVDHEAHLEALSLAGHGAGVLLKAVVDVDMSLRLAGSAVHLGVRRSPVRSSDQVFKLISLAKKLGGVRVIGMMGYEAQVAGLADANPFDKALNPVKSMIRKLSIPNVASRRKKIGEELSKKGFEIELFNGGGTGSLKTTTKEDPITEVTAGSGFLCSALFSYYKDYDFTPAAFFALQVVRVPAKGMVTCLGGGYVASGPAHADKLPVPFLPKGLTLLPMEGAGEIQTPVVLSAKAPALKIGDPILFRHSKAGELAEHFNKVLLIRDGKVVDQQPTYRGMGKKFL